MFGRALRRELGEKFSEAVWFGTCSIHSADVF